jgi:hypothetical protein
MGIVFFLFHGLAGGNKKDTLLEHCFPVKDATPTPPKDVLPYWVKGER